MIFDVHHSVSPFLKRPRGSIKLSFEGSPYAEIDGNRFVKSGEGLMRIQSSITRFSVSYVHPVLSGIINQRSIAVVNLQGHEVVFMGGMASPYRVHLRMQPKMTLEEHDDQLMIWSEDLSLVAKLYKTEDTSLQDLDLVARIEIIDGFELESRDALLCGLAAWQFLK